MTALPLMIALAIFGADPEVKGPGTLVTAGHRVHLYASEDLHPDSLASLARPGVVLWLSTRSNALPAVTVERLRRFGEAWIELRAPILKVHASMLERAPKAGLWFRASDARVEVASLAGVRRVAVEISGPFDEAALLRAEDAARVNWSPASADLEGFSRLMQMRGVKTLFVAPGVRPPACEAVMPPAARVIFRVRSLDDAVALSRCGAKVRVAVDVSVTEAELMRLFAASPGAELELEVGDDERRAVRVRQVLERLERASGHKGR